MAASRSVAVGCALLAAACGAAVRHAPPSGARATADAAARAALELDAARARARCLRRVARGFERALAGRQDGGLRLEDILRATVLRLATGGPVTDQVARWSLGPLADNGGYAASLALDAAHPSTQIPAPRFAPLAFATAAAPLADAELALRVPLTLGGVRLTLVRGAPQLSDAAARAIRQSELAEELAHAPCTPPGTELRLRIEVRSAFDPFARGFTRRVVRVTALDPPAHAHAP